MHPRTLRAFVFVLALVTFAGCAGWFENTKAALLTANNAVNAYDDVAGELFADVDSPEHPQFDKLEASLCFTYSVQDLLLLGWSTAAMVDAGIAKKTDFGFWAAKALLLVDTAINEWEVWTKVPAPITALQMLLRKYSPESPVPLDWTPPDGIECKKIVKRHTGTGE